MPGTLEPVLQVLSENTKIKLLNLSWNNLVADYQEPCKEGTYNDLENEQDDEFNRFQTSSAMS